MANIQTFLKCLGERIHVFKIYCDSTNEHFNRKEMHGSGEQACGCQEEGEGVKQTGNLGLIDETIAFGVDKQ